MELYLFLGIYILILLGVSIYGTTSNHNEDFLIGGRDRKGYAILFSKFSGAIGVSTLITYTGYAYRFGWGLFIMSIGTVIGYLLFAFWAAPKIKRMSVLGQFYTQGDLPYYTTKSKHTATITNITTSIVQFFWVVLSLAGGAKIIAHFEIMSYEYAVITTAIVVLSYVLASGFKAVIITDIIQGIIIILFLVLLIYSILYTVDIHTVLQTTTGNQVGIGSILGLLLYGGLSVFGLADRYQLCYAAKDEKAVKKGMGLAIIPILIIAFLLLIIGLSAYIQNPSLDADMVFVYIMKNGVPQSLTPVLLILFFAGLMSTSDTATFAVASHTVSHVKKEDKVKKLRLTIILTISLAATTALFWNSIVDITIVGAALRMTLAIPMLYIIKQYANSGRFMGSTIGGLVGFLIGIFIVGSTPTLILFVIVGALFGLLYKSKTPSKTF